MTNWQPLTGNFDASGNLLQLFGPVGKSITDALGAKLRRLAADAAISNPIINLPLTPPAAWVAATAYTTGAVVANGGNQYICYVAGTSAGAGGPSGTGAAPIVDNTVSWHYYGVPRITASSPFAPTLTYTVGSNPAGLTNGYLPDLFPANYLFTGATPEAASFNWYRFPAVSVPSGGNVTATKNGYYWAATFETDAPKVAIGTSNSTSPSRFIIDGQYFYDGGDSNNSGNPAWRVFDFSGARKVRRFTIEGYGNFQFTGARVDPQSQIWAPNIADQVKVAVLGSSIEAGGNSYPIIGSQAWCIQLGKLMGWSDVRNMGLSGTGYANTGGTFNYAQHLSDVTSFSPDIVIVGGPINDTAGPALQAAALNLFQLIRAALPGAVIIAGGTFPSATGPDASRLATEANISDAVTAFGDARTFFVPIATDSLASWVTGTGKVTATTGTGNADVYISSDGTHPVQNAIDYEARRWAAAIRQRVLPALT